MHISLINPEWESIVKSSLPKPGDNDSIVTIEGLSINKIEKVLSDISGEDISIHDFNGVDGDWNLNFKVDDLNYSAWGSHSGNLNLELEDGN